MHLPFNPKERILERRMRKLEEATNKKLERMGESFSLIKNILMELRKENEELRKDRQFLLDKLKGMLMELERQKIRLAAAQMAAESERESYETHEKTYHARHKEGEMPEETEEIEKEKYEEGQEKSEKTRHVEQRVETPLDELLELVVKKGSVKIADASRAFKVKARQIEDWARILEEHELIEIHYPVVGKPMLKKKTLKQEKV